MTIEKLASIFADRPEIDVETTSEGVLIIAYSYNSLEYIIVTLLSVGIFLTKSIDNFYECTART